MALPDEPQQSAPRAPSNALPPAAVYIAALPRSGSTMLANLLSSPPDRWVLVEPGLHTPRLSPSLAVQINRFRAASATPPHRPLAVDAPRRLLVKNLAELLGTLSAWGLKEVGSDHRSVIAYARPAKTIILVRDIRDALLSLLEKHDQPGRHWESASLMAHLAECCAALIRLSQEKDATTRIYRYEDLVSSASERQTLSDWLSWPLNGDTTRNLDLYNRQYEAVRHQGTISAGSVGRHAREGNHTRVEVAAQFSAMLQDFSTTFGYGDLG